MLEDAKCETLHRELAHSLRTPLSIITLSMDLLSMVRQDEVQFLEVLEMTKKALSDINAILDRPLADSATLDDK